MGDAKRRHKKAAKEWGLKCGEVINNSKGKYEVKWMLGNGAFGHVFECRRTRTIRSKGMVLYQEDNVAVKVQLLRCMDEVTIMRKLGQGAGRFRGANVMHILGDFMYNGMACLVLELMPTNLWSLLNNSTLGKFSIDKTRMISRELLFALSWLKTKNIIHADIKLNNILVDPRGSTWRIKLADFGCSFTTDDAYIFKGIKRQVIYVRAPEIILGATITEAIDMWSLGCLSAWLVLGNHRHLFPSDRSSVQLHLMVELLGKPPREILRDGLRTAEYFARDYQLKQVKSSAKAILEKIKRTRAFNGFDYFEDKDFALYLKKCLNMDPTKRLQPREALHLGFFQWHEE